MGSSDTDRTRRAEIRRFALSEHEALRPGCDLVEVVGELDLAVAEQLQTMLARTGEDHDQISSTSPGVSSSTRPGSR
jgi:hypothetical protein